MSELLERLISRTNSDMKRGISFHDGINHYNDLLRQAIKETRQAVVECQDVLSKCEKLLDEMNKL